MSTDRPPTPPLDLEAIEERMQHGVLPSAPLLLAEVRRLRADLAREKEVFSLAGNKICKQMDEIDALRADLAACRAALASDDLLERLAELSHDGWAGWTGWMFEKWDQTHASGETFQQRWVRQMSARYADLSEQEKESDRAEARKVLALVRAALLGAGGE